MNTIKMDTQPFLDPIENIELKEFFEKVFNEFNNELNWINVNLGYVKDENDSVFDQIEMTWVGIFNNAIIKAFPKEATTLLEYAVYSKKKRKGRADLLVRWRNTYLLFEAKRDNAISTLKILDKSADYKEVVGQIEEYFALEKDFFQREMKEGKTVYLIPIFFGRIYNGKNEDVVAEARKKYSGDPCSFCVLYENNNRNDAVWVYGKIIEPQ